MTKTLRFRIVFVLMLFSGALWAQTRTVSGKVTMADDGSSAPGVNVVLKGTTNGTTTDSDGNYKLSLPNEGGTLVFSFIGLATQEVIVGDRTIVDVNMTSDTKQLSEVVVVGYGTQEKRSVTGSISNVSASQFQNLPLTGIDQALQGRAAGVQVSSNSGTPGGGISVRVRGSGSILAGNDPLYVVNGIPINTGNYSQLNAGNQQTNALTDLNPNDIESIEVLKDASASAIYGSRATNGVVLITTKKGKQGKAKLTFDYYQGVQQTWKRITPLTGAQQVSLLQEEVVNRYGVPDVNGNLTTPGLGTGATPWASAADLGYYFWGRNSGNPSVVGGFNTMTESPIDKANNIRSLSNFQDPNTAYNTNWQDQIFRTGSVSNYQLGLSGGDDKSTYSLSGGYYKEGGIITGFSFDRLNASISADHKVSSKLKIGTNVNLSRSVNNRRNNDNNIYGVLSAGILMASDIPVRNPDGSYGKDPSSSVDNPVALANETKFLSTAVRALGGIYGEYEITKGLTFTSRWSMDYRTQKDDRFLPTTLNAGFGVGGDGTSAYSQDLNWVASNYFNYRKSISNHNISATAGADYQQSNYESIFAESTGYPGNQVQTLSAGSVFTNASSSATSWGLASYYGRANYDYLGRYLFGASVRTDGSSRFAKDFKYGTFYSISGGWRFSEESFMSGMSSVLSDAKLRVSYGTTGNSNFGNFTNGNFSYLTLYGTGYNYNGNGGYAPTQIGNTGLKWESATQLDFGLDFTIFNRFTLNLDYYDKKTSDLLLNTPIPSTSGFSAQVRNLGSMENKGWDIGITSTNISNGSFTWKTNFNISGYKNNLVSLGGVQPFAQGFASRVQEGQPLGSFYGYAADGVIKSSDDLAALNAAAVASGNGTYFINANTRAGDLKFKDLDGNGIINSVDQKIIGNANPKFFGGLTNTMTYKGFDLMFFLQYSYGNDLLNWTRVFATGMNTLYGQFANEVGRRWTPTNIDTDVPRAVYGDPSNNRRASTRYIEDGSYLRIKNVVLGYTLPADLIKRLSITKLRVYASAQNLYTFTNYSGFDPEVSTFSGTNTSLGTDFLTYPQYRSYTFGVNLTF
jgi:TonB-linked SusC/RagA family outer membrane protein